MMPGIVPVSPYVIVILDIRSGFGVFSRRTSWFFLPLTSVDLVRVGFLFQHSTQFVCPALLMYLVAVTSVVEDDETPLAPSQNNQRNRRRSNTASQCLYIEPLFLHP